MFLSIFKCFCRLCPCGELVAHILTTKEHRWPTFWGQNFESPWVMTSSRYQSMCLVMTEREMTPSRWCWSSPGTIPNPPGCLRSGSNLNIPTSPSNLRRASAQTRDWGVCLAGYTKENWILLHSFSPIHKMWFWCLLDVKMSQILSSAISQYQYSDFICIIWTQNL